jgi:subtilase family serine protease
MRPPVRKAHRMTTLAISLAVGLMLSLPFGIGVPTPTRLVPDSPALRPILPLIDLFSTPAATPGYANGDVVTLNGSNDSGIEHDTVGCPSGAPFLMSGFTASPDFGTHELKAELVAVTTCGVPAYTVHWTFGDGNVSSQSSANVTLSGTPYEEFIYNHTFEYIGSFIPSVKIGDGNGTYVTSSTDAFVSFTPNLFRSFYNESNLISGGDDGSTYSIGLVEYCAIGVANSTYISDLSKFDTKFGLTTPSVTFVRPNSTGCQPVSANQQEETDLDIQWAHVAAPGANIYVCESSTSAIQGLDNCDLYFYDHRVTDNTWIVSNSWGECGIGSASGVTCVNAADPNITLSHEEESVGMNVFASVGDYAPSQCISAEYPASNNYTIAAGGTTVTDVGYDGSYGSEESWYNATTFTQCRLSSGHGVTGSQGETYGNNPYYPAPSWQSNVSTTHRYFPDVSLNANESTGVPIVYAGNWAIVGGTSVSSPAWAGILDVLFSASTPHLSGFSLPFLYSYPTCFHPMTNHAGGTDGLGTPNVGCLSRE